MRCPHRTHLGLTALLLLLCACGDKPQEQASAKPSPAPVRAERRAYEGAPPVIPHKPFGMRCVQCHNETGMSVPAVGYAPPSPHENTAGMSEDSRCRQCHVEVNTTAEFRANSFRGVPQTMRKGERQHTLAPPTMPHPIHMRENCLACHTGPAARAEIRCSHPERTRCVQCHLPVTTDTGFTR